ncbi:lysine transporter LysE [Aeromicrobium sp. Root495]|uniref:LysE family translocator n=1 Tax=Aeromicrobium sp. Root495 TaxID=1736550 RepID=UPI0006FB967F|nr:LysE family translocator [Aeromicrobium sp. Root495]KQY60417.1 lysine transporter LysE [Aeromicrobium sp. Root495]
MLTISQALAFGLAAFVLIAIPGPSVVFVIGRAIAYGRDVALLSVLGNTLGLVVVLVLVAAGLGYVVQTSAVVYTVLKLAGAAYLVWLGVQAWRHRRDLSMADVDGGGRDPLPRRVALRQGFVVGVSNPKAFMIFAAVLPPFVDVDRGHVTTQPLLLGAVAVVIGLASDSVWALVASRLRTWFAGSRRRTEAMGAIGGTSMIGLGVGLALTGRPQH